MRTLIALVLLAGVAAADPTLRVQPTAARPGDAVLVTVTGTDAVPHGSAGDAKLHFFRAKQGYQALFAIPLDAKADDISVEIDEVKKPARIAVGAVTFPETSIIVEDEFANPPAEERKQIDADNAAIVAALKKGDGEPEFTRTFVRPRGAITSRFGEWRTFNDGHRSQHLGFDVRAREGAPVHAINAGTVTLVRDTFLAGRVVVIAHGGGIATAYFHLSEPSVSEGDAVTRGQEIGFAGKTGRTTGPHLHVGVRVPGGFVDPQRFFNLPIAAAPPATARR